MASLRGACAAVLLSVALSQSTPTPEPSAAPPALSPCSVSDHGATYDLTGLATAIGPDGTYADDRTTALPDFEYYYNVCNVRVETEAARAFTAPRAHTAHSTLPMPLQDIRETHLLKRLCRRRISRIALTHPLYPRSSPYGWVCATQLRDYNGL